MKQAVFKALQSLENAYNANPVFTPVMLGELRKEVARRYFLHDMWENAIMHSCEAHHTDATDREIRFHQMFPYAVDIII